MFSGYGGAEFALQKAGIDFEVVGYSEIDKFAIQCYEQNHSKKCWKCEGVGGWCDVCNNGYPFSYNNGEEYIKHLSKGLITPKNYGDATKIDPKKLPDFDLLTGGFPCQ